MESRAGRDLLDRINEWIINVTPWVGEDFDGTKLLVDKLSQLTNLSAIPGVIGTVASAVAGIAVGLFSVLFISFFFIKDEKLFGRIVGALVPDRIESQVGKTILDIERLLSRYFVGVIIEIFIVLLIAIPTYTVIRVIASRFFYNFKPVRRLIPDVDKENTDALI